MSGLFYLCLTLFPLAAAAQAGVRPGAPLLLRNLFKPGIQAEIRTINGQRLWLDGIRLGTPADFTTLRAGDPVARFSASTAVPEGNRFFGQIQQMNVGAMQRQVLGSNPQDMEYYRLGDIRNVVPPPPDWQRAHDQIPPWRRAVAVANLEGLPFLNQAFFCWAGRAGGDERPDLGVYLFRQPFRLDRPETIARATLRVASNVEVLDGAFNECPLHLAGAQKLSIAEYEVTPLVREGVNLAAFKVRGRPGLSAGFGLAFHLEIERRRDTAPRVPRLDPGMALLMGRGGDRIWGSVRALREDGILFGTRYGDTFMDWDDCAGVLFPAGWQPPLPRPGLPEKLFQNAPAAAGAEPKLNALPLTTLPRPLDNCLLLTEGRLTSAKPSHVTGGKLYFDGPQGKQVSLPLEEVLGIIPPRPEGEARKPPPSVAAILYCQVSTRTGERFSGLLRQIGPETVVLETGSSQMLSIGTDNTATIEFPYHAAALGTEDAGRGAVGVLAPTSEEPRLRTVFEEDVRAVRAAGHAIGIECRTVPLTEWASENMLRPGRYPVLAAVDPAGQYLDSYYGGGDARQALLKYLESGGVVVALSRGGVFRAAMEHQGGGKLAPAPGQTQTELAKALEIETVQPTDPKGARLKAFSSPPNEGGELFFERAGEFPAGLRALPGKIELAPMLAAPFYPAVARAGKATVLYNLSDAGGRVHGPALSLVPHGRGWLVVIDDLLWESRVDGRPFTERVLPILLKWAIEQSGK